MMPEEEEEDNDELDSQSEQRLALAIATEILEYGSVSEVIPTAAVAERIGTSLRRVATTSELPLSLHFTNNYCLSQGVALRALLQGLAAFRTVQEISLDSERIPPLSHLTTISECFDYSLRTLNIWVENEREEDDDDDDDDEALSIRLFEGPDVEETFQRLSSLVTNVIYLVLPDHMGDHLAMFRGLRRGIHSQSSTRIHLSIPFQDPILRASIASAIRETNVLVELSLRPSEIDQDVVRSLIPIFETASLRSLSLGFAKYQVVNDDPDLLPRLCSSMRTSYLEHLSIRIHDGLTEDGLVVSQTLLQPLYQSLTSGFALKHLTLYCHRPNRFFFLMQLGLIAHLPRMTSLRELDIDACAELQNSLVQAIQRNASLHQLSLSTFNEIPGTNESDELPVTCTDALTRNRLLHKVQALCSTASTLSWTDILNQIDEMKVHSDDATASALYWLTRYALLPCAFL